FGATLIAAYGLDAIGRRSRGWARLLIAAVVVTAVVRFRVPIGYDRPLGGDVERPTDVVSQWSRFAPVVYQRASTLDRDRETYRRIAAHVEQVGPGPLLEWPSGVASPSAIVGQMIHRQPSIAFYTGYVPAHLALIESLSSRLTTAGVLDDLVDMTHLTW